MNKKLILEAAVEAVSVTKIIDRRAARVEHRAAPKARLRLVALAWKSHFGALLPSGPDIDSEHLGLVYVVSLCIEPLPCRLIFLHASIVQLRLGALQILHYRVGFLGARPAQL
jgi:hypothetical protein